MIEDERWAHPMTAKEIAAAKEDFTLLTGRQISECTCYGCHRHKMNTCQLQFDAGNIDGDCLYDK